MSSVVGRWRSSSSLPHSSGSHLNNVTVKMQRNTQHVRRSKAANQYKTHHRPADRPIVLNDLVCEALNQLITANTKRSLLAAQSVCVCVWMCDLPITAKSRSLLFSSVNSNRVNYFEYVPQRSITIAIWPPRGRVVGGGASHSHICIK